MMQDKRNSMVPRPSAREVVSSIAGPFSERLAEALDPAVVGELASHLAAGKATEIVEGLANACADALAEIADRLGWPEDWHSEARCARCGGVGSFGVTHVSRRASVQWETAPGECLDPEGCGWPYDPCSTAPL
jgi:hypothetical protein